MRRHICRADWKRQREIPIRAVSGVRYTVPASLDPHRMGETQVVRFRVGSVYKDAAIEVSFNGKVVSSRKKKHWPPARWSRLF